MSTPLNSQDLEFLRLYARFGTDGEPRLAAKFLCQLLRLMPLTDHKEELARLIPDEGLLDLIAYMGNDAGVMTHGCGIGGSWLAPEGEELMARLADVDFDLPFDHTPRAPLPVSEGSPPDTIEIVDSLPISTVAYSQEFNNVFWNALPAATEPDEIDMVCSEAGLCGCGERIKALRVYFAILQSIADGTTEFERRVPDPGMRQFILYQLQANGILSGVGDGALSPAGEDFRQKLSVLVSTC